MRSRTQQLAIKAKEEGLDKAAKEVGATMMTSDLVDSTGQVPQLGDMGGPGAVAFTLQPGQISGPILTERTGVVLKVLDKQAPTEEQIQQNLGCDPRQAGATATGHCVRRLRHFAGAALHAARTHPLQQESSVEHAVRYLAISLIQAEKILSNSALHPVECV